MKPYRSMLAILFAAAATTLAMPASADDDQAAAALSQQLAALDADPGTAPLAAYERLQARQAIAAMDNARSSQYDGA